MVVLIVLGAEAYVGWNIGANYTANCVGTTVGWGGDIIQACCHSGFYICHTRCID